MVVPMKPPHKGWKVLNDTIDKLSSLPCRLLVGHDFLHARVGPVGLQRAGWIRMAYATLFLWDRFLLGLDLELFFHPKAGLVPLDSTTNGQLWTLFRQADTGLPVQSMAWYWVVYLAGMAAGLLLWLGVAPRIQLAVVWLSSLCFEHHNQIITDAADSMFTVWAMLLMFLPLHHVTVWDGFGYKRGGQDSSSSNDKNNESKSWPIWSFRLWQLYMSLVYIGASVGKLHNSSAWVEGYAMYNIVHNTEGYPGMWNPPLLFGRRGPLLLMTWTAIVIEVAAWWSIWIKPLRRVTLYAVVAFHVGIDLSMNMTCLQWLTILGWCVFLIQPETEETKTTPTKNRE